MAKVTRIDHGPLSVCSCGHDGDGAGSLHRGLNGHGACTVPGCECEKFTWKEWTPFGAQVAEAFRRNQKKE